LAAVPDRAIVDAARAAVSRALELDPELGDAHATASTLAFAHDRNFARAERAALDAIRHAPGRAYVHHNYAWMLTMSGRFVEAEHEYATAHELDPLDPMLRVHCALVDFYRRDFLRAERAFVRVLEMEPANLVARSLLGASQLGSAQHEAALATYARVSEDVPHDSIGWLGVLQAHAIAGRMQEARAAFDAMLERFGAERTGPYRMAIACARLGDPNGAFTWLERAAGAHDLNLVCLAVDPSFDALRDDERWMPALGRYGLPQIDSRSLARA
jgi:tetratricopeptide (TPR) repeat protein